MSKRTKSTIRVSNDNKDNYRTRMLSWLGNRLGVQLIKTTPRNVSYIFQPEPIIRKPSFDYVNLFEVASTSWVLRRAFGAIIRECTRNRWKRQAKFKFKCKVCEKEYQEKVEGDKCISVDEKGNVCSGELRVPSEKEYKIFGLILDNPNPDYKFDDIVRSSLFYSLALDDWYWGVAYKETPRLRRNDKGELTTEIKDGNIVMDKIPAELYIEDARFLFPVADEYGHLGNYEYFCPLCYDLVPGDQPVVTITPDVPDEQREKLLKCPYCGKEMVNTAYVQEANGTIIARFTKDEIVHGSTSRVLPELFGSSRIISVWTLVQTILAMDGYNYEVYSEGKVGALLGLPGYDQLEIGTIKTAMEEELKRLDNKDITTGRFKTSKKIRTLMMGLKKDTKPERVPLMNDLKDMQSLEFYNLYIRAVDGVYGVTSEFIAGTEGGESRYKIEVDARTVKAEQSDFCDLFNSEVLPKFGINDWILVFNPSEPKDKFKEAQVHQTRAAAAFTYLRGGFNVSIGPDGDLLVEGTGKIPEGQAEEGFGARADESPRAMGGKPWRWEYGSPSRTQGEEVSEMSKALVGIPMSWHSLTQIRLKDRIYAVDQEQDEVYVTINGLEVKGTRTQSVNFNEIIGYLVEKIMDYIGKELDGKKEFNKRTFDEGKEKVIRNLRRGLNFEGLVSLANYMDSIGEETLALKIDNLRQKLEKVVHDTLKLGKDEIESITSEDKIEKQNKESLPSLTPYAPKHEEKELAESLNELINKVKDKKISKVKAIKEAEKLIDKSYEFLKEQSLKRTIRRTGKKDITLSKEEEKRLSIYKEDALEDFKTILEDAIK